LCIGIELHRFAIRQENIVAQLFADRGEGGAQGMSRLFVGRVTPQQCGEFFASVCFGMEREKSEQRFDLAGGEADELAIAFETKRAEEG
jgi:hypothetical protein